MPRRFMFVALAGVIAMGGLVVAQSGAGAVAKAKARPAVPAGLDHFLCYNAASTPGTVPVKPPNAVTLLNQFSPNPFKPKFAPVDLHCNPALKIVPSGQFPPKSPSWHLMCYQITGKQTPNKHLVQVSNQFGTARLNTGAPNQFCLPSLKSLQTPPQFNPPGPNEIMPDHFTCYPTRLAGNTHFKPPTAIQVKDQFAPGPIQVQIGVPVELCVPTQKSVKNVVKGPITNPAAHLLCFEVTQTPVISPIWDKNQFGTGQLNITNTRMLCLPSDKKLIH
jgi:hypothetical protein